MGVMLLFLDRVSDKLAIDKTEKAMVGGFW